MRGRDGSLHISPPPVCEVYACLKSEEETSKGTLNITSLQREHGPETPWSEVGSHSH